LVVLACWFMAPRLNRVNPWHCSEEKKLSLPAMLAAG
jgi:hypothetical protein